jgi:hypothetical protein
MVGDIKSGRTSRKTGFRQLQILESHRNADLAENLTFQALRAQRAKRFANALVSGIPYREQFPSLTDN